MEKIMVKPLYCPVCGSDYIAGYADSHHEHAEFSCMDCGNRWTSKNTEAPVYGNGGNKTPGENVEPSKEWFAKRVYELEEENVCIMGQLENYKEENKLLKDLIKILVKEKK